MNVLSTTSEVLIITRVFIYFIIKPPRTSTCNLLELKKQAADQGTKLGTEFREGLTKAQKEARATEAVQEAKR